MTCDEAFKELYEIVVRLRGSEGCPWDREQTPLSLRGNLIEETYECVEAIDKGDPDHVREELGDVFLLVIMLAYMYEQDGQFSVAAALEGVCEKLIRRHPHVFGPSQAGGMAEKQAETDLVLTSKTLTSKEVLQNWAKIKVEREGRKPKDSLLDEVSRGLPPLDRAWKLQKKAAKAGFDWPDTAGVIDKIKEELRETEAAIADVAPNIDRGTEKLEGELGDLLFSVVNLCRFFEIAPSVALQRTNIKFYERFKFVEKRMKEAGVEMNAQNLNVMDSYWNEAKELKL